MPTGGLPALATTGGHVSEGARAGAGVAIGPSVGGPALFGAAAVGLSDKEKAALGEGPDVDRLGERDVGEARSRERHEQRAAEGRKSQAAQDENAPRELKSRRAGEARTEKAKHIPPPGDAFNEWFDSLTLTELDDFLADEGMNGVRGAVEIIGENIRHPGGKHEWLMVAEARQIKKWGVSMKTIQEGRSLTDATIGRRFRHSGMGAGRMHREVRAMIRSSNSYGEFLEKLNQWADRELAPSHSTRWPDAAPLGRYSLPDNLQLRSR